MSTRPSIKDVARDVASFVAGWVIVFKQAGILFDPPAQVNEVLIAFAALVLGVPGAAQLWAARTSTGNSASPPPSPESSPSSSGGP